MMKKDMIKKLFWGCCAIWMMASCQDDYFVDSGRHEPVYDGTVMEYIQMRKDIFDSLYRVIELSGLESALEQDGVTFFAPGDASIRKSLYTLNEYLYNKGRDTVLTLDQVDPEVWREYLSMYIYNDTYLLKDIPQIDTLNMGVFPGQGFVSYGGTDMNIGVNYNDVVAEEESGNKQVIKYAGYRQLFLSYIGGFGFTGLTNAPVATSDIVTSNGVIHALEYRRHSFGFISSEFARSADNKGIIYK